MNQSTQTIEITRRCEICNFYGVCKLKPVLRPEDIEAVADRGMSDALPLKWHCITCFDTPYGYKSPNITHKRLAEEEYKK